MDNKTFADAFKVRTKKMAVDIIRLARKISNDYPGQVVAKQLIRSATSVAANYRAACRARSIAEFIAKIGIVEEEADESCFWLEVIIESELGQKGDFLSIHKEMCEISAIVTATAKTTKQRYKK